MRMSWQLAVMGSALCLALPQTSWGQVTGVSVGGSALLSIQPVVDENVGGGPYFSGPGMGGIGPGLSVAFNVVTARRFSVTAEFSTAKFEAPRSGRVVGGPCPPNTPPNECSFVGGTGTAEINDSMLGVLVGRATGSEGTQAHFFGGAYWLLDEPTVNGHSLENTGLLDGEPNLPVAPAAGFDIVQRLGPAVSLVVGARYAFIFNDDRQRYFGISPHVIRAGVGVRFRFD